MLRGKREALEVTADGIGLTTAGRGNGPQISSRRVSCTIATYLCRCQLIRARGYTLVQIERIGIGNRRAIICMIQRYVPCSRIHAITSHPGRLLDGNRNGRGIFDEAVQVLPLSVE